MFAAKSVQKMLSSSLIAPQDRQEVILVSDFTVMTLVGEDANRRLYLCGLPTADHDDHEDHDDQDDHGDHDDQSKI